ncbi:TPA: protease inhibitor I42 family protein [Bacillus cereus]
MMKKNIFNLLLAGGVIMSCLASTPVNADAATTSATQSTNYIANYAAIFTESSHNKTVSIKKGETFAIRLYENGPSTGFVWKLDPIQKNISLETDYIENIDPGNVKPPGSGAPHMFVFKAHSIGITQIKLKHVQPWMNIPNYEYKININITQ